MSDLERLMGLAEVVEVGGIKLTISPWNVEDLPWVTKFQQKEVSSEMLKEIAFKVLKANFPEDSDDKINEVVSKMPLGWLNELSEHIARVNKFKTEKGDAEQAIIDKIKMAKKVGLA